MAILIKNVLLDGKKTNIQIEQNKIKEIGSNDSSDIVINGEHHAIMPGLINMHTHAAMTLFRGYADDMELNEWLTKHIWPAEAKLTEQDVYNGSKLACLEMIKSGTTFFNDMYWHPHGTARAVEDMGIRTAANAVFIDLFNKEKADEQIELSKKLFNEFKDYSDRIIFTLGPHAIYTVSQESLNWIKEFSEKNNLLIHIHVSETEKEVKDCIEKHKKRPVEYLNDLGFLGKNVIVAHGIWLDENEARLLGNNNCSVVYNPSSNMKLASGVLNYDMLKRNNVNVCLGTDGCASNNNLDMFEDMKIASLLQKIKFMDPTLLKAKEVYEMATLNGGKALGLNIGLIKEGYLADLILVNLKKTGFVPNHNLISNKVYSVNGDCVDTVICDGKILMENRKVNNEDEILEKAQETAEKLR